MAAAFALAIISGNFIFYSRLSQPAELVGAKPLHLLTQDRSPLKSPTGAFIATQTRAAPNAFSQKGRHKKAVLKNACFHADADAPAGSQRQHMLFTAQAPSRENGFQESPQTFLKPEI